MNININYDMRIDTPSNKDPDTFSKTLNEYHSILWSKELPNSTSFKLSTSKSAPYYLYHQSDLGDLKLASDSIIHSYSNWKRMAHIVELIQKSEIEKLLCLASTIGGYIIFPAKKIDNKPTINGIRGFHYLIKDRFDLTLECIRLWYSKLDNPLTEHLERYKDYFNLFVNFKGYVNYFLLNDLVSIDYQTILFWLPFNGFEKSKAIPGNVDEYNKYMHAVIDFVNSRNERILKSYIDNKKEG